MKYRGGNSQGRPTEGPPGANAGDRTRVTGWRAGSRSHSDSPALRIGKLILFEKGKMQLPIEIWDHMSLKLNLFNK